MGFRQGTPKMLGGEACGGLILVGFRQGTSKMLGGEACKRKMYDLPANGIVLNFAITSSQTPSHRRIAILFNRRPQRHLCRLLFLLSLCLLIQALYLFSSTACSNSSELSIIDSTGARALRATTECCRRGRGRWQIVDSNLLVLIIDCNG
jgi:hypothetical protein